MTERTCKDFCYPAYFLGKQLDIFGNPI